jgi:DNA-binding MarR family transcriptional regulator
MSKPNASRRSSDRPASAALPFPQPEVKMDLRLWVRLLACAHAAEQRVKVKIKERFGINQTQFNLLSQLDRLPDGIRAGELSRRTIVTGSNVTAVVDDLVDRGLVKRAVSPEDRRAAVIQITPKGQAAFDRWAPEHAEWIAAIFRDFPVQKKEELIVVLDELKLAMKATLSQSL